MRWLWLMGSPLFQNTERCFEMKCQIIETSFVSWLLWNHREIITMSNRIMNCVPIGITYVIVLPRKPMGQLGQPVVFFWRGERRCSSWWIRWNAVSSGGKKLRSLERWVNVGGHGEDVDDDAHHHDVDHQQQQHHHQRQQHHLHHLHHHHHHHHDQLRRRKFQPLPLGSTSYPQKIDCRISPALWTMIQQAEEK